MALTGLDIYKLLPKTNCKDCAFATCLAFAMALAQKKTSLDKCPHVSAQAKEALESASQPPVKLVTVGVGERKLEMGNETVMYRHEQKFYHPTGIGLLVADTLSDADIAGASVAIFAADLPVQRRERFAKIKIVEVPVQEAIKNAAGIFAKLN